MDVQRFEEDMHPGIARDAAEVSDVLVQRVAENRDVPRSLLGRDVGQRVEKLAGSSRRGQIDYHQIGTGRLQQVDCLLG